jgi:hypothetical protein
MRSLPHIEALSLFRAEESQEERDARESVGLVVTPELHSETVDVVMAEPSMTAPAVPGTSVGPIARAAALPVAPVLLEKPTAPSPLLTPPPGQILQPAPPKVVEVMASSGMTEVTRDAPLGIQTIIEEEKNEEMPAIDLGSDSDSD